MSNSLYDRDFYAWANEQGRLLREGRFNEADMANIIEEIETLGRGEKRELLSRLEVLLTHLLKWEYQPHLRGRSWRKTVVEQRDKINDHLEENPSLHPTLDEAIATAYRRARRDAAHQTRIAARGFPETCPWAFERMMDENFWPEA